MRNKKLDRAVADILFAAQIVLAIFFCGSEFLHLTQAGVGADISIMMFVCFEIFIVLGLALARSAYKKSKTRKNLQTVWIYAAWAVGLGSLLLIATFAMIKNPTHMWNATESLTLLAVIAGISVVAMFARHHGLGLDDQGVKGGIALTLKAVPQLGQGVKIAFLGGASWNGLAVLTGHITILIRLAQIWMVMREEQELHGKASRELRWLLIAEVGNELSWLFATVFWLVWFFGSG